MVAAVRLLEPSVQEDGDILEAQQQEQVRVRMVVAVQLPEPNEEEDGGTLEAQQQKQVQVHS